MFTISIEDVNEDPTEMTLVAKPGGTGVDFETDQPIIMENTERGATVAQLVVLDPDLQEEMTVLLSRSVVAVGTMSCLSLTKVTALVTTALNRLNQRFFNVYNVCEIFGIRCIHIATDGQTDL